LPGQHSPPEMVDPVPDLLNGPRVVAVGEVVRQVLAKDKLATGGRLVSGIATDWVTQVVIRIPANNAGDRFTVTVLNDQGVASALREGEGALGPRGQDPLSTSQAQISVPAVTPTGGPFAFAFSRAPADFARSNAQDATAKSRG